MVSYCFQVEGKVHFAALRFTQLFLKNGRLFVSLVKLHQIRTSSSSGVVGYMQYVVRRRGEHWVKNLFWLYYFCNNMDLDLYSFRFCTLGRGVIKVHFQLSVELICDVAGSEHSKLKSPWYSFFTGWLNFHDYRFHDAILNMHYNK
jgi:hypothetical protein